MEIFEPITKTSAESSDKALEKNKSATNDFNGRKDVVLKSEMKTIKKNFSPLDNEKQADLEMITGRIAVIEELLNAGLDRNAAAQLKDSKKVSEIF